MYHRLLYYKVALIKLYEEEWLEDITHINAQSNSEGGPRLYRKIKSNPVVEHYVSHIRLVGERCVMACFQAGCLPLAVENREIYQHPIWGEIVLAL